MEEARKKTEEAENAKAEEAVGGHHAIINGCVVNFTFTIIGCDSLLSSPSFIINIVIIIIIIIIILSFTCPLNICDSFHDLSIYLVYRDDRSC